MDLCKFERLGDCMWQIPKTGAMRVPGIIYATEPLIQDMDDKVYAQVSNVATLPGIVKASYAMPDAHWGYGFPIGGVAAFDADAGGVICAGGVGFDVSCGVRTLVPEIAASEIRAVQEPLAAALFSHVPAGLGSTGRIVLSTKDMDAMLKGGARWAVEQGYGTPEDLAVIEENGGIAGADPDKVSEKAKERQRKELGTLGSGNHYLEVQEVEEIFDEHIAEAFGLKKGNAVISIHCGSRGLGHQIGSEYMPKMASVAKSFGIVLVDKELASAPILSPLGQDYLGAMRTAINCALANRQVITGLTRQVFAEFFPGIFLSLLYDVSHNTCKVERHRVNGQEKELYVHRKGATRALGPLHPMLSESRFAKIGQPVLVGGSMGTHSFILVGTAESENLSFSSACHGAGRTMSRIQAKKSWQGSGLIKALAQQGIIIKSPSMGGVAEEAPLAYKDVSAVVMATEKAGLARRVVKLKPLICIKG